jgi:hypothetical protein
MWMEWTIPIQKLEVNKIQVGQLQKSIKPLAPLSYSDGPIVFQNLNVLLPPLPVKDYDATTGRLLLSLQESTPIVSKLLALQEALLQSVYTNQRPWFGDSNRTREQISLFFQPFVENNILHLYCPQQIQERRHVISIWKDDEWKKFTTTGLLQKGDSIRVALRLQGISFQMTNSSGQWTGRCRVQHKISSIYSFTGLPKPKAVEEQKC